MATNHQELEVLWQVPPPNQQFTICISITKCKCCKTTRKHVSREIMLCVNCSKFYNCQSSDPEHIPEMCKCCHLKRPLALVTYTCGNVHRYYICKCCHQEHTRCPHDPAARETLDSKNRFEEQPTTQELINNRQSTNVVLRPQQSQQLALRQNNNSCCTIAQIVLNCN